MTRVVHGIFENSQKRKVLNIIYSYCLLLKGEFYGGSGYFYLIVMNLFSSPDKEQLIQKLLSQKMKVQIAGLLLTFLISISE